MKKIILINFFLIIFITISLELLANFFKISNLMGIDQNLIKTNLNNHITYKKNSSGIVFNNLVYTDQYGFRVPQPNPPSSDYKYSKNQSVIFYGDSVTFGNGIDEEMTFVGLIRKKLTNFNVYNISLPGYQITNHIKNLAYIDNIQNVKKIIYFYTLNDVDTKINLEINKENNIVSEFNKSFIETLKKNKLFKEANSFLRNKSYLYLYIKGIASDPSKRWFFQDLKMYSSEIKNFEDNLLILKKRSDKDNIIFKIIILPYEYQTRKKECNKVNLLPQIKIKKLLVKHNINFRDLTDNFCNAKNPKSLFYKFDPMHLSKKGHKFVYNLIKDEI